MVISLLPCVLFSGFVDVSAWNADGCTSIVVGRGATVDGSAITSHVNDCDDCDFRMIYVPARDHPVGSNRTILSAFWDQYPRFVDPSRSDQYVADAGINSSRVLGSIPQVPHTYAMWEASYSIMNEHGLGIGETTASSYLIGVGVDHGGDALFTVGNLITVALERCISARCAVQTMGDLGSRYGFYGEEVGKDGAGEAVTVVDSVGEAWVFHITGGVPNRHKDVDDPWAGMRGALWVAQRVPEGHLAVLANNFIIQDVDPTDTDNFMLHPGLFALAKEAGLWDGKSKFNFLLMLSPDVATWWEGGSPPIPQYTTMRMWDVLRKVAPSRKFKPTNHPEEYPFSVPVEKKLSHLDVMNFFRSHFEGTEFDMRLGALAGPWQSPNRVEGGDGEAKVPGEFARSFSIPRTSYAVLIQSAIPYPVTWYAADAPASSVFVPFFADVLATGGGRFDIEAYGQGSMKSFSFGSSNSCKMQPAWWAFDFVANWLELSYQNMSETYVYPAVQRLQMEVDHEARSAVAAVVAAGGSANAGKILGEAQFRTQRRVTEQWWALAEMLVVRYNDGFFNFGDAKQVKVDSIGYPAFWLEMVGYNQESYRPTWMKPTSMPPTNLPRDERLLALKSMESHIPAIAAVTGEAGDGAASFLSLTSVVVSLFAIALLSGVGGCVIGYRLAEASISSKESNKFHSLE
eukprot:TRINITY_DN38_c0_g1_i1.p1 TRINITY_DN38_c0_g1~~TRINITY_DN38_c0_g1_i1.p1  ORF type:complete len:715 (-),score=72.72 TRINITY_DN38_c0_g1_i1:158-2215(-)